ncbi:DUF4031 domain-containing protein [Pseudomonas sp. CFBP 13719]|uniref:DUF4031 domain-containing protein n=1 Tax=Pseudomonas sp. CFBP 13719 TaxID=2775303 RepID=UPI00177FDF56|nr:DUF4031 domain-containing protein [Pseudomonas sp. CFBP 13719]MBD8614721.1 DUF4031 domain-containing protein [Pseudomonas putida]MBD8681595.1 DUF4031 domain-containing protein [Pseudomonas sp. CFBP 13719]
MTIYVDDMKAAFGGMVMCHMISDSEEELHQMADKLGISRSHHQAPPKHHSHYDIAQSKRALAIKLGAVQISQKALACMCMHRKLFARLGSPEEAVRWRMGNEAADEMTRGQTPDLFG